MNKLWDNLLNSILLFCILLLVTLGIILCITVVVHLINILW